MALPKIKNITDLKKDASKIIAASNEGELTLILHKTGNVVLVPIDEYERLKSLDEVTQAYADAELDRKTGYVGPTTDEAFENLYKKHGLKNDNMVKKSPRRAR